VYSSNGFDFFDFRAHEQGCGAGAPELSILPRAGAQIKSQKEPDLNLKFRTGAGAVAI